MSERKFDDFDEHAKDYRDVHSENIRLSGADSYYFAEMKVQLLREFEKNIPAKVLDVGCGDGATGLFMKQYFPAWEINGIDVSSKSIEVAEQRHLSNCKFNVYDGLGIPFPDDCFDVVFMAGVLHHVNFSLHQSLLNEIYRVMKKGGHIFLFEHNPFNPLTKYLVKTCVFDKDARLLRPGYTRDLLKNNKFKLVGKRFIIFFPRKGFFLKLLFLEKYLKWLPVGGQYFMVGTK